MHPEVPGLAFVEWAWLIGLPVCTGLLARLVGRRANADVFLAVLGAAGAFGLVLMPALAQFGNALAIPVKSQVLWFSVAGGSTFNLGFRLDSLSAVLVLAVLLLYVLVVLYSAAYFRTDERRPQFYLRLGGFVSAMLLLVLADNLLLLFVGWELIGLASFRLIGFWSRKPGTGANATHALLVNRLGDVALLTGMLALLALTGTLDISVLGELLSRSSVGPNPWALQFFTAQGGTALRALPSVWAEVAGVLLVAGALIKAGQFPFQAWLPDAMAAPTPASALLHAATLVAAGPYLVLRLLPVLSPAAFSLLLVVGSVTALWGALMATAQHDVKRLLAFSTLSQLGLIFTGLGALGAGPGLFHLATHAVFKAGLFLTAGAITTLLAARGLPEGNPQHVHTWRGLGRKLPLLAFSLVLLSAALVGVPFTSGFLSKESLLVQVLAWAAAQGGAAGLVAGAFVGASALTAFYTTRLLWLAFGGEGTRAGQWDAKRLLLWIPPAALSLASIWWGYGGALFQADWVHTFGQGKLFAAVVDADYYRLRTATGEGALAGQPLALPLSLAALLVGVGAGVVLGRRGAFRNPVAFAGLTRSLRAQFGWASLQRACIERPVLALAQGAAWFETHLLDGLYRFIGRTTAALPPLGGIASLATAAAWVDARLVDGTVNAIAGGLLHVGRRVQNLQTGRPQAYLVWAIVALALALFLLRLV